MKKQGILNAELSRAIAALGHNDLICIGDAGLPIPKGVPVIDLAVVANLPLVSQVLEALDSELVVQEVILANESDVRNPKLPEFLRDLWPDADSTRIKHSEFKAKMSECRFVIRTGEYFPYANVMLVCGVAFPI